MSINFPLTEYENALVEFNGNSNEAIRERIVSNPIHVYQLIKHTEIFGSEILPKWIEYSTSIGIS